LQAEQRRWPNLDVHDIKQRDGEPTPDVEFHARGRDRATKRVKTPGRIRFDATKQSVLAGRNQPLPNARVASLRGRASAKYGQHAGLLELFLGHLDPPACSAEGMARPPVSPVYVLMVRVADFRGNPASRAQTANRSVDQTTGRWARFSRRYVGLCGASGSSDFRPSAATPAASRSGLSLCLWPKHGGTGKQSGIPRDQHLCVLFVAKSQIVFCWNRHSIV
jgi:hypothetical protein